MTATAPGAGTLVPPEPFSILLVDNDLMVVRVLNRILHEFTPIRFASSGPEALKLAHESVPDLVLLDVNLPEMNGFEVCKAFKLAPTLSQVPIVFVTSHQNAELQAKAMECGAADFISKPPEAPVVLARVRNFQRMKTLSDTLSGTLRNAGRMDFLTGTIARREFEKMVTQEWLRADRSAAPLALLLASIDGFAAYNAEFGEDSGDACLQSVADALRSVIHRAADVLGRYGGGKFAILLPETDATRAGHVAQQAIDAVDALQMRHAKSASRPQVTLTVGGGCRRVAHGTLPPESSTAQDLIAAGEKALKSAGAAGGHQSRFVQLDDFEATPHEFARAGGSPR
jgi:diguanylate cyclase (GGDEF)-like protein